jgi:hypothetical protein
MDQDIVTEYPSLAQCVAECNSDLKPRDVTEGYPQADARDNSDMQILLEAFRL